MGYRDDEGDPPICPECSKPAIAYVVMWDEHRCENGHYWDGPTNGGPPVHSTEKLG